MARFNYVSGRGKKSSDGFLRALRIPVKSTNARTGDCIRHRRRVNETRLERFYSCRARSESSRSQLTCLTYELRKLNSIRAEERVRKSAGKILRTFWRDLVFELFV